MTNDRLLKKLDKLLDYIENISTEDFCKLIDSLKTDNEDLTAYAKLEKIILNSSEICLGKNPFC